MADRTESFPWSSVPFGLVSLVMFGLSNHESRKAKQLQQAHPVASFSEVMGLARFLPVLIAIRGKTASNKPLYTKITSTPAVLIEDTAEWSALKQNDKGVWLPDTEVFKHYRSEAKWHITENGGGGGKIGVESCLNASHLEKTLVTSKQFTEGETSTYKRVINRLSGYQPLGVWQTERSLPVGTSVTVVGELAVSSDGDGSMVIRKPSRAFDGKPFYITNQTFDELQDSIWRNTETYKWVGVGFGTVGLILMGIHLWKHVRSTMRYRRIRKQIEQEKRRRTDHEGHEEGCSSHHTHEYESEHPGKCIVCWDRPADAVFIPCGHLCACLNCCLELKRCPVCRDPCSVHKIFMV